MRGKKVIIYTDGSCKRNPGPGGWALAIVEQGTVGLTKVGSTKHTTNNRMEMQAVLSALKVFHKLYATEYKLEIRTDSALIVNTINQKWYVRWQKNNWQTSKKTAVSNQDLWVGIIRLLNSQVSFTKVKGHSTDKINNLVDSLANAAANKAKMKTRYD